MITNISQLGINISEEKLQLVELNCTSGNCYLENIDEEYFEEVIDTETKESKFINILQNAFNEIILRKSVISKKVSVSLPLSFFKTFEIPVEEKLTAADLNEYLKWEFSKLYPTLSEENFVIQSYVTNNSNNQIAFVFALEKSVLKIIRKFCVRNNLILKNVDNSNIASSVFLQNQPDKDKQLSVFIDNHRVSIILFSKGKFQFYKQKEYKSISELALLTKDIYNEVKERYLKYYTVSAFTLWGNVYSDKLKEQLEKTLELTAQTINPFQKIKTETDIANKKITAENPWKFSSAMGMALRFVL